MKLDLKPNPEFLRAVPAKHRRKWAEALLMTKRKQARHKMVSRNGAWCCLMVGHDAFGGTRTQRSGRLDISGLDLEQAQRSLRLATESWLEDRQERAREEFIKREMA